MAYEIELKRSAEKELARLPKKFQVKMVAAIEKLEANPRHPQVEKLTDRGNEYRVRVGEYRILFTIADTARKVCVSAIRSRQDAYRKK